MLSFSPFDFGFSQSISLMVLAPAIFNVIILLYLFFSKRKNYLINAFIPILIVNIILQVIDGLFMMSQSEPAAHFWNDLYYIMVGGFVILGVNFVLLYTDNSNLIYSNRIIFFIYVPQIVFLIGQEAGFIQHNITVDPYWGWIRTLDGGGITPIYFIWLGVIGLFMPILFFLYAYKEKNYRIRFYQSLIIGIGFTIPLVQSIITQVIFPMLLGITAVPLFSAFSILFSITIVLVLLKYRMFGFMPGEASMQIIQKMHEGFIAIDKEGSIRFANRQFEKMLGIKDEETSLDTITSTFQKTTIGGKLKEAIGSEKFSKPFEASFKDPSGKVVYSLINIAPFYNKKAPNKVEAYLVVFADITTLVATQEALRKREEEYRLLVENMNDALVQISLDGKIEFVNQRFCDVFEFKAEEVVGHIPLGRTADEKNWKLIQEALKRRAKGISDQYEQEAFRKSGGKIWTVTSGSPLRNHTGEVISSVAIITDITPLKEVELKLRNKNEELNTFVYKSSHDMRGPLASIVGITNIAQKETKSVEEGLKYFEMINSMTTRLDNILVDLAQVAKVSHSSVRKEKLDVSYEIEEIIKSLSKVGNYDKIDFKFEMGPIENFLCDKSLFISIIQNLIQNAIIYHNYKQPNPSIEIKIEEVEKNAVKILIADNGNGMSEEVREKAFNMFYRGNSEIKGSGLGLYMVKNAMIRLGGDIILESEVNKGSTFTLIFNMEPSEEEVLLNE